MTTNRYDVYLKSLPYDWAQLSIEQVGEIFGGGTPSRNEPFFWNGTIRWVTPSELAALKDKYLTETRESITKAGLASCAATLLPQGTLLVTTRATIGSIAIAAMPVSTNQGFKNIVLHKCHSTLFYYYFLSHIAVDEMRRLASGSTFDEISRRDFIKIILPQPSPSEQHSIADILSTVDEQIKRTEQLVAKLKLQRAGLLHDLLTRGIDEHGQLRDPVAHPEQFKDELLGKTLVKVPKKWEITVLGNVVLRNGGVIQTGPFGTQLHASEYVSEGVPVIMPQDIRGECIDQSQIVHIMITKAEALARHKVEFNDVVFACRGSLDKCAFIDTSDIGSICGTDCLLVRSPKKLLDGRWLAAIYRHCYSQQQIRALAVGSTMMGLNTKLLAKLVIAKPPLEEQVSIMNHISSVDSLIYTEQAYCNKLKLYKKGLMHDLLTGHVRVALGGTLALQEVR